MLEIRSAAGEVRLVNLTPHEINIVAEDGTPRVTIPASGTVARVQISREEVSDVNGIPVYESKAGEITDLPPPKAGTYYIVSRVVAEAAPERSDLIFPDELVRNERGVIIGCKGFSRVSRPATT